MKSKSLMLSVLIIMPLTVLCSSLFSKADPPVQPILQAEGTLMRSKLKRSQNVLEGLIRKDFKAIANGAKEMRLISEAAEWPRARDSVYEHFSAEFRRQCSQLEELAENENHQGVTYAYLHMTNLCIQCHDYVRDSLRIADRTGRGGIQPIPSQWPEGSH